MSITEAADKLIEVTLIFFIYLGLQINLKSL